MYVAVIPNRGSPPAILRRESYRETGKPKNRTLANLSRWPAERIEQLRAVLRGDKLLPAAEAVEIVRALPHGHVLAALGTARRIALDTMLPRRAPQRRRDLALALIVARLLEPAAKLATARMLDPATASHSLGEVLGLGKVAAKEGYAALDWLNAKESIGLLERYEIGPDGRDRQFDFGGLSIFHGSFTMSTSPILTLTSLPSCFSMMSRSSGSISTGPRGLSN